MSSTKAPVLATRSARIRWRSFMGEQRDYVKMIAAGLKARDLRVFYDATKPSTLGQGPPRAPRLHLSEGIALPGRIRFRGVRRSRGHGTSVAAHWRDRGGGRVHPSGPLRRHGSPWSAADFVAPSTFGSTHLRLSSSSSSRRSA